jgi:hypothetical protein
MADQILPKGFRIFPKHANAPDFVLGTAVITMNELFTFCKGHPELVTEYNGQKQLKLQLLRSKEGKLYAAVDTFKPQQQQNTASQPAATSQPPLEGQQPIVEDTPF